MEEVYKRYIEIEKLMKDLKEEREALQMQLYERHDIGNCPKPTFKVEHDNIRFTCTKKTTTKIDQEKAARIDSPALAIEYKLDKRTYNSLPIEDRRIVEECMTVVVAKPTFKVEVIGEEKNDN